MVLGLLLAGQVWLANYYAVGAWAGDEPLFVAKAEYLWREGRFPPVDRPSSAASQGNGAWNSDWRPPGYPTLLALLSGGDFSPETLRRRVAVLQSSLMSLALLGLFWALVRDAPRDGWQGPWALVLGLQPWCFAFSTMAIADSVCASLTTLGLVFLISAARRAPASIGWGWLALGTLLSSATFLFRPDRIVSVPVLVISTLALIGGPARRLLGAALLAALVFSSVVAVQVGYRHSISGERELFGTTRFFNEGAFHWLNTGTAPEKVVYDGFAYKLMDTSARVDDLPPTFFRDAAERSQVAQALDLMTRRGAYDAEIDKMFDRLAEARIRGGFVRYVVWPRIWKTGSVWITLETSPQVLNALAGIAKPIRRVFLGGLVALKISLLALAAVAGLSLVRRALGRRLQGQEVAGALCLVEVVVRTLVVGVIFNANVNRHLLPAWPALIGLASLGHIQLLSTAGSASSLAWRAKVRG